MVSVDGKASCGPARKATAAGAAKARHALNVYSNGYGMCLTQKSISEKTNEIPAAQEILRPMNLKGTIITADAMNCQKETAAVVMESGRDYVLALKGNHGLFHEEVKDFFDTGCMENLQKKEGCYKKTVEPEHGGVAAREYYITKDNGWYSERGLWKGLESFGMVHKRIKKKDGS